jgi:hypothetical protein
MEISDLNPGEKLIIESLRADKKIFDLIDVLSENYDHIEEGEETVKTFLNLLFENLSDFSEINLKAQT